MAAEVAASEVLDVEEGQYAPIPDSATSVLGGPGKMRVNRYRDGKLSIEILEGKIVATRYAIHKKWRRVAAKV